MGRRPPLTISKREVTCVPSPLEALKAPVTLPSHNYKPRDDVPALTIAKREVTCVPSVLMGL